MTGSEMAEPVLSDAWGCSQRFVITELKHASGSWASCTFVFHAKVSLEPRPFGSPWCVVHRAEYIPSTVRTKSPPRS